MWNRRVENVKTTDEEFAANERRNIVVAVVAIAAIFALQILLGVFFGVRPHWGPL